MTDEDVTVCVVGLGHIGLPTALLLATGHDVVGVDVDESLIAALEAGDLPFEEPGLADLFDRVGDRFAARTEPVAADAYVITVPTPLDRQERVPDLGHVRAATGSVAAHAPDGALVVLESTVPPGTSDRLVRPILADGADVDYAHCPERAIPENTLHEMTHNDRVVGADDPSTADRVERLYDPFLKGECHVTDPTTAELVKLMENTQRDVDIALANEFAKTAESAGVDVHEAIDLANRHPRVEVLRPGPGVGGHCITVDPWFLTATNGHSRLVPLARDVNDTMADHLLGLVREATPRGTLAVLGASYKGNVGDTRLTPARRFCRLAENEGYDLRVTDPHADAFDWPLVDLDAAVEGADCAVVLTDHDSYADLDPERLAGRMATPTVVDSRAIIDRDRWRAAGFDVTVLGDGSDR